MSYNCKFCNELDLKDYCNLCTNDYTLIPIEKFNNLNYEMKYKYLDNLHFKDLNNFIYDNNLYEFSKKIKNIICLKCNKMDDITTIDSLPHHKDCWKVDCKNSDCGCHFGCDCELNIDNFDTYKMI